MVAMDVLLVKTPGLSNMWRIARHSSRRSAPHRTGSRFLPHSIVPRKGEPHCIAVYHLFDHAAAAEVLMKLAQHYESRIDLAFPCAVTARSGRDQ